MRLSITKSFKKLNAILKSLKQPKASEELVTFLHSPFSLPLTCITPGSIGSTATTTTTKEFIDKTSDLNNKTRNACKKCTQLKSHYSNQVKDLKCKLRQARNDVRNVCLHYDVKRVNQQLKRYTKQITDLRKKCFKLKQENKSLASQVDNKSSARVKSVKTENLSLKRKLFHVNDKVRGCAKKVRKLNEEVKSLEVEAALREEDEALVESDEKTRIIYYAIRKCIYFCLVSHVPVKATGQVIKYITECQGKDAVYVPHPSTISRCAYELGILCDLQCGEFLVNAEALTLAWDATTLKGTHINQVVVSSKDRFFTLATDLLPGGTSEDYAEHLVQTLTNIIRIYAKFSDNDSLELLNRTVTKFRCTMSDRASVNHCTVVRLMTKLDVNLLELNCVASFRSLRLCSQGCSPAAAKV
ncbi:hypothetical protein ElyMa_002061700 [Elysia marginata]|uniref:Uncharacterized protein n=1 Tax=Elysia marginata TaxID=1093978 RepID=A0AAV4FA88_9GAST|nr:hypothetical protein ElyMa_002061700 [Elysia marginata]